MSSIDNFPPLPDENKLAWFGRVLSDQNYLKTQANRVAQEAWKADLPVWRADKKGIYNLHKDGTKEYLKTSS